MSIDVKKVAHLARLSLTDQDQEIETHLNNILKLADEMQAVNTDNISPMAHPMNISQPLRADEVTEQNQRDLFQTIAPNVEAGLYLVPQVIDNSGDVKE